MARDDCESQQRQEDSAVNREEFEATFAGEVPKLRGVLRRMVGHPDDVDDLAQQAMLRAFEAVSDFRGDSSPGTWLCAIGSRLAIDHLRKRKRWRERAQVIFAAACLESEALAADVGAVLSDPEYDYDVRQHIAYCFTCVGRTLEPRAQAALVLRDVVGMTNDEAADALRVTKSVLRHELAGARTAMQQTYEGLCALVNKDGICWQCAGLREVSPPGRKGAPPPDRVGWSERLKIVDDAPLDRGSTRGLHDVFFRHTERQEEAESGDDEAVTDCGRPD